MHAGEKLHDLGLFWNAYSSYVQKELPINERDTFMLVALSYYGQGQPNRAYVPAAALKIIMRVETKQNMPECVCDNKHVKTTEVKSGEGYTNSWTLIGINK